MNAIENDRDIEELLGEADALIESINSAVYEDFEETRAVELEKRLNRLKDSSARLKEELSSREDSEEDAGSYAEGYHEAYQDIVKALGDLKSILS